MRFDRPMVALGVGAVSPENAPLKVTPPLKGEYRWLDPMTLAFIPPRPLTGATRLKLSVPAGIKAADGSVLAKPAKAVITVQPIKAVNFMPQAGKPLGPEPQVKVIMNQALNLDSLTRRSFWEVDGKRFPALVKESAPPAWQRDLPRLARLYEFALDKRLTTGQKVRLLVEPGVMPATGDLPLAKAVTAGYISFESLALKKWEMPNAYRGGKDPESYLTLNFNNPVNPSEAVKFVKISPAPARLGQEQSTYPTRWLSLPARFKPCTAYRITLLPGLTDSYGASLAREQSFGFKTGDFSPLMELPGDNGVLETTAKEALPLKLRNLDSVKIAARWFPPDQAVKGFREESERNWRKNPVPPKAGQPHCGALTVNPGLAPNRTMVEAIGFRDILGQSPRGGLVLLDVRATWPDHKGKPKEQVRRALVQVTDLGLSLKLGPLGGLAWVTSLATGKPVANAALELRDRANRVLWQGQSGAGGLAAVPALDKLNPQKDPKRPWLNPMVWLMAKTAGDWAVLPGSWGDSLRYSVPYTIDYQGPGQAPANRAHALFQLPLYQPGQTVRYVVYLQGWGEKGLAPLAGSEVTIQVNDPMGRKVHELKTKTSAFGSASGSFGLTSGARLGSYGLTALTAGKSTQAGYFRVASFRPPDFRVSLKAPDQVLEGMAEESDAKVSAGYLFGSPVAKGKASLKASQRRTDFAPERLTGYSVGDLPLPGKEPDLDKDLGLQKAVLDAKGQGGFKLPKASTAPGLPVRLLLHAGVEDAGGLSVTAGRGVLVHPSSLYLGLKAPLIMQAGEPSAIELAAAGFDNAEAKPAKVTLVAYRQWWETVREKGPGGFFHHLTRAKRKEVWRGGADLSLGPAKVDFTPPRSGSYVLVAEATDAKGRTARSATYAWATGKGISGWQRFDDHRLEMVADKKTARPGDSLELLIKNPFADATALVTVERRGISRTKVVRVEGPSPVVKVPIFENDAPGVYVGILLVRGRSAPFTPGSPDLGRPQVRIGYVPLKVSSSLKGPEVKISTPAQKYRPGQKVEAKLRVSLDGKPVESEITLLAVDERILAAAGGNDSYDPAKAFGRMPPLGVMSADLRTRVLGRFALKGKGDETGGGGGRGPAMRRKFLPAVFWLARAATDANGGLSANFTLPDSLTAYRIVAVAALKDGRFGLGQTTITASLPLQLLSALPRFAVKGDEFKARVLLQNLGEKPAAVEVSAHDPEGLKLTGEKRAAFELSPGESRGASFAVKAVSTGRASIGFTARTLDHADAARFALEVIPATALETFAAAGVVPAGAKPVELDVAQAGKADPARGGLAITLAPSVAANLAGPVRMLLEYPWNCLEQRLSRSAARWAGLKQGGLLGLKPEKDGQARLAALGNVILDYQTGEGSFGFWPGAQKGDYFLTAYTALALYKLKDSGAAWDDNSRLEALRYLGRRLSTKKPPASGDLYGRLSEAMAVYALSLWDKTDKTRSYFSAALTRKKGLPPFGLACLMMASGRFSDRAALDGLVKELETTASVSAAGLHFAAINPGGLKLVMGSSLRGNALVLEALATQLASYPRLDALARWVARGLAGGGGISTQDAAFGLWSLAAYLKTTSGKTDLLARAVLGQKEIAGVRFTGPADPPKSVELSIRELEQALNRSLFLSATGGGSLFWSSRLSLAPKAPPKEPANAGFAVSRFFRSLDQSRAGDFRLGSELECLLTVIVPETRRHVLIQVPFPAGLEPENAASGADAFAGGVIWQHCELRKSSLVLYAPQLRPGVYSHSFRLRAVARGSFLVKPARAEEMYSPEVFGRTSASGMEIR